MVSGTLLLPVKVDMFTFLRHRFAKIFFPLLFWTAVYMAVGLYYSESEINIIRTICSIPFSTQGHSVLWFMYTLAGLYLLAPIISGWLCNATKKEVEFALLLWAVTLCYPLLEYIVYLNSGNSGILYYFTGYAGYFVLGYYLNKWPGAFKSRLLIPLVFVSLAVPAACKLLNLEVDFYHLFWYLSIFVAVMAVAIWEFIARYCNRLHLFSISRYTFGIYLCHILVMRFFLWKVPLIYGIGNYFLRTIVIAIATFAISLLLCALIGKLPYGDYIIGDSTSRRK